MTASEKQPEAWQSLQEAIHTDDADRLREWLVAQTSADIARAVSRLDETEQRRVLTLLSPQEAAALIVELPEEQAAGLLKELSPAEAAAILDLVPSDEQADLLAKFSQEEAVEIVETMSPEEAADVRHLSRYAADTAGGLMLTEYLAYSQSARVSEVINDIREHAEEYSRYDLQYIYVTDAVTRLAGVLPLRDLLFASESTLLSSIMRPVPHSVRTDTPLDDLESYFDRHPFFGAPVTDADGHLVGVVLRADVEDALGERTEQAFLRFAGIIGGEEFRTMRIGTRISRRLAWLALSIVLNLLAASIVGLYQDTLASVIALAMFLPVISGLSGSAGNQALAVSLRELSLGLVQPNETLWVALKEASVGIFNGLVLGAALGIAATVWQGNAYLGVVVAGALFLTTVVAVCLGGIIPLLLKRFKLDPAIAAAPIVMTLIDMCGFYCALSLASILLSSS